MTGTPDPTRLLAKVDELRRSLSVALPDVLAARTGADYHFNESGEQQLSLSYWQQRVLISYPDLVVFDAESGAILSPFTQALLMYYFSTADGTQPAGHWIAFSELPDGRFYTQAYQGYTGNELARAFPDGKQIETIALSLGGLRAQPGEATPGDMAFVFRPLPRLPILLAYWEGDEDFPASYQILFDAFASHYLPTDGCAMLGSALTRKILSAK